MSARNSAWKRQMKQRLMGRRLTVPCCFCRRLLGLGTATLEHILPLSKGGGWDQKNLALSCHGCNQERGVTDFRTFQKGKRCPSAR